MMTPQRIIGETQGRKPSCALIAATALLVAVIFCGCVTKNAINSQTSTVFGIQLDQNQNGVPSVKFGLIRSEWHVVPISSNGAPKVLAITDAELQPFGRDRVHKVFATGEATTAPATTNWFPMEGTNAP